MNPKIKTFIKNVGAMLFANGISFFISALITFIIPKFLNVENYAYVQLYIFYTSYVSFLHYGWVDGIRLRYGGIFYEKINKELFNSQIILYSIIQFIVSILVINIVFLSGISGNKLVALTAVGFCMLIRLPRIMPQYILEMSNRIQECAKITLVEKISYILCIIITLITGKISVTTIVCCDLVGQILSAIYAFVCCKDILTSKPVKLKIAIDEAKNNIAAGIKLTLANISSLLIIGIVRQFIELKWDIETFGKISLTISISNLLMVFIKAVSMVMFPTLRRVEQNKLKDIYTKMRICIMVPLLLLLVAYYPLKEIIQLWLPQYSDSLKYMSILFPMCVFESKMSMLIETYLKTLRLESEQLKINIITVLFSLVITVINTSIIHNLNLTVLSIVILLAFRCIIAEKTLAKKLEVDTNLHIVLELLLVTIFITTSWLIGGIIGLIIYICVYIMYLLIVKEDIKGVLKFMIGLKKNEKN